MKWEYHLDKMRLNPDKVSYPYLLKQSGNIEYRKRKNDNKRTKFYNVMGDGRVWMYSREYFVWSKLQKVMNSHENDGERIENQNMTGFCVHVCSWRNFVNIMLFERDTLQKMLAVNFDYIMYGNRMDCWKPRNLQPLDAFYEELSIKYSKAMIPMSVHVEMVGNKQTLINIWSQTYALPLIYVKINTESYEISSLNKFKSFCEKNKGRTQGMGSEAKKGHFTN